MARNQERQSLESQNPLRGHHDSGDPRTTQQIPWDEGLNSQAFGEIQDAISNTAFPSECIHPPIMGGPPEELGIGHLEQNLRFPALLK